MQIDPEFSQALNSHHIEMDEVIALQLQNYVQAMWDWNEKLNLTRHTTWDLFVSRDLRDCLQLAPLLETGEEVLDLGSGNGVPGIPLSILRPDIEFALAESVAKRAGALGEIVGQLGLPVPVYGARGEDLLEDFRFTTIVRSGGGQHCEILSLGRAALVERGPTPPGQGPSMGRGTGRGKTPWFTSKFAASSSRHLPTRCQQHR